MSADLMKQFASARRVSTPLIAIRTPDPSNTMNTLISGLNGKAPAILAWDSARGIQWKNELGMKAAQYQILGKPDAEPLPESDEGKNALAKELSDISANPFEALLMALRLPQQSVMFMANLHSIIGRQDAQPVIQAIWNLRDVFKMNQRTLVMTCPDVTFPPELAQDVLTLDEPLPARAELAEIVQGAYANTNKLEPPDEATLEKAVDALSGLAAFPAEQVAAMSLVLYSAASGKKSGIDIDGLWERKRQLIDATPGLSVNLSGETFDEIGGCENAKAFFRDVIAGAEPPRAIVFIDEIEKSFGGSGSDSSGVSQGFLGTMLSYMTDNSCNGSILIGPPGAAKSAIAKATGNTAGVPTITLDMGGMKGSLVGQSEQTLRNALKVVTAVSQGRALFLATCNSISTLPPELRRRFNFTTMFFDLPSKEERAAIWQIYISRYGLDDNPLEVDDNGWTGAEIRNCCYLAYNLRRSIKAAANFVIPVVRSAPDQIERLRREADGRFTSASYPGPYRYPKSGQTTNEVTGARKIALEEVA